MKSKYWTTVGKRFTSLTKTALQTAVPVALDSIIIVIIDKTIATIKIRLSQIYKESIINSIINLILNISAIMILYFRPFKPNINTIFAGILFLIAFTLWIIRLTRMIIKHGRKVLIIVNNTIKEHNIYKGIEKYILDSFPKISLVYTGINIGEQYIPTLKRIPKISEMVRFYITSFRNQVILFAVLMSVYAVSIYWVIRPIILKNL